MKYRLIVKGPDFAGDVKVVLECKKKMFGEWKEIHSGWALKADRETDLPTQILLVKEDLKMYAKKHKMANTKTVEGFKV